MRVAVMEPTQSLTRVTDDLTKIRPRDLGPREGRFLLRCTMARFMSRTLAKKCSKPYATAPKSARRNGTFYAAFGRKTGVSSALGLLCQSSRSLLGCDVIHPGRSKRRTLVFQDLDKWHFTPTMKMVFILTGSSWRTFSTFESTRGTYCL